MRSTTSSTPIKAARRRDGNLDLSGNRRWYPGGGLGPVSAAGVAEVKVRDEDAWQQLLAEFATDTSPLASELRDFTIAWADMAERILSLNPLGNDEDQFMPMVALRHTLRATEHDLGIASQRVTIGTIGAALVLLTIHWVHGEDLYDEMTIIEKRLVEDSVALKMMQLQDQAEQVGEQ